MKGLLARWFPKAAPETKRLVLLVDVDGEMNVRNATETQAGWVALRFESSASSLVRLLKDGKVEGYRFVKRWLPHSGWTGEERFFEQ